MTPLTVNQFRPTSTHLAVSWTLGVLFVVATVTRTDEQSSFKQGKKAIRQNDAQRRKALSGKTDYNPSLPDRKVRILPTTKVYGKPVLPVAGSFNLFAEGAESATNL